jgi:hypothetical protein
MIVRMRLPATLPAVLIGVPLFYLLGGGLNRSFLLIGAGLIACMAISEAVAWFATPTHRAENEADSEGSRGNGSSPHA